MNVKYLFGALLTLPFLPVMYWQGRQIKNTMPQLPEANGKHGIVSINSNKNFRLLAIGESTVAGVGVAVQEKGFVAALARELSHKLTTNVNWHVYAKSGCSVREVSDHILPSIDLRSVDLIVIGVGANDAFRLNYPRRWNRTIRGLISRLRVQFRQTPIAFISLPPIKEFPSFPPLLKLTIGNLVELFGKELSMIVEEYEQVYYHAHKLTVNEWCERLGIEAEPTTFFSDGIHPTQFSYDLWAQDFSKYLFSCGIMLNHR